MSNALRRVGQLMRRRWAMVLTGALVGAGAGVAAWAIGGTTAERAKPLAVPNPPVVDENAPAPRADRTRARGGRLDNRPVAAPPVPARPPRLEIPAIGVRAHATSLGKTRSNKLDVPRNASVVGWWRDGSVPGQRGVAVVVGHVDSQSGPAVFYRLRDLQRGNEIRFVRRGGSVARFRVTDKERFPKRRFPTRRVYAERSGAVLRLITCGGNFDWSTGHYRDNVVVYAKKT